MSSIEMMTRKENIDFDKSFSEINEWDRLELFLNRMASKFDDGIIDAKGLQGPMEFLNWEELVKLVEMAKNSISTEGAAFLLIPEVMLPCAVRCFENKKKSEKLSQEQQDINEGAKIFTEEDLKNQKK